MRLMHERAELNQQRGGAFRAMALIPDDPRAGWNRLLRHSAVVAKLEARSDVLEQYRAGAWRPTRALRDMKLIVYPRAAGGGGRAMPLLMAEGSRWQGVLPDAVGSSKGEQPAGYVRAGNVFARRVLPGSMVYIPEGNGLRGRLFQVAEALDVDGLTGVEMELDLRPLLKNMAGKGRIADTYDLSKGVDHVCYEPSGVWMVDHLVHELAPESLLRPRFNEAEVDRKRRAAELTFRRFAFDWREAQREIQSVSAALTSSGEWEMVGGREEDVAPYVSYMSPAPSTDTEASVASVVDWGGTSAGASGPCPSCEEEPDESVEAVDSLSRVLDELRVDEEAKCLTPEQAGTASGIGAELGASERAEPTEPTREAESGRRSSGSSSTSKGAMRMYAGMACGGCGEQVRVGGVFVLGSVVHPRQKCKQLLARRVERAELLARSRSVGAVSLSEQAKDPERSRLAGELAAEARSQQAAMLNPTRPIGRNRAVGREGAAGEAVSMSAAAVGGGTWKRVQADEALSAVRQASVTRCIDGLCTGVKRFEKTRCSHCPRGLHVAECAQLGTARGAQGKFKCFYCRAEEMAPHREPTESRLQSAKQTMLIQLQLGSEATAGATADFNQLEQDFVLEKGLEGDELLLPRHNRETFMAFLVWCYRDAGRARSMKSMWRHLAGAFRDWQLPDLTKDFEVKKHQKELDDQWSHDPDPTVSATERMADVLIMDVIPAERDPHQALVTRDQLMMALEAFTGARVGEVADAGQGHGVLCENVSYVEDLKTKEGFLDVLVATSKTKHPRYTGVVRRPTARIDMKAIVFELWNSMGAALTTEIIGGLSVTRADRYVVRLSLMGMQETDLARLMDVLASSGSQSARHYLKSTFDYAKARIRAYGVQAAVKRFVNVGVGTKGCAELQSLVSHLGKHGYGGDRVHIISAPFICATTGGSNPKPTIMPLASTTITGGVARDFLVKAALAANIDPKDPDPDMNIPIAAIMGAKWGTHSLRRLADKRVKKMCAKLGLPTSVVDSMLGWKEAERLHDMQDHYDEKNLRQRMERARVTGPE